MAVRHAPRARYGLAHVVGFESVDHLGGAVHDQRPSSKTVGGFVHGGVGVVGSRKKYTSVQEYLADIRPEPRRRLNRIRQLVKKQVPGAEETISYNIPAFRLRRVFMYYAAFRDHISIFPPLNDAARLAPLLKRFRNAKGNLLFDLREPMPYGLIARVARALAKRHVAPKRRKGDRR